MANLVIANATVYIADPTNLAGTVLPAAETALTGKTGFQFQNNPAGAVVVRIVVGASGAGNLQLVAATGAQPSVVALANSTTYIFGPFDPAVFSSPTGLVQATLTVVTGNSVGIYLLPGQTGFRALHNPFESVVGASDY
jgi:hypothetical protein